MLQQRQAVRVDVDRDTEAGGTTAVYRGKRGRLIRAFVLVMVFGVLGALGQLGGRPGQPVSPDRYVGAIGGSCFVLLIGSLLLVPILRGAPRLTIDREGLVLRGVFRTTTARWDQLGPFTPILTKTGQRGEGLIGAWAPITPESGRRRRKISLPNTFTTPLATILETVARHHRGLPPGSPAVITRPVRAVGVPDFRFAWMTTALLLAFVGLFVLEQCLAVTPPGQALSPSVNTLIAMGGLNWTLVRSGQWFRLFCAPFLHAGLAHLVGNMIAFVLVGYNLERLLGRGWTFLVFAAGALAGSGLSLLLSPLSLVSVGASGGIMAMLVAFFVVSFRMPRDQFRTRMQIQSARLAIPALLPLSRGAAALHIDYGAHLGGALLGLAVGGVLLGSWQANSPLPRLRTPALAVALAVALCFVAGGVAAVGGYRDYLSPQAGRIPSAELPRGMADVMAGSDRLVAAYPRDPIAHFYAGEARLQRDDLVGAELHLRSGLVLALAEPLHTTPEMLGDLRGALALVLLGEARPTEAQVLAREACTGARGATPQMLQQLEGAHLCAAGEVGG